jgi:acetylornithine deacetylase/succinyl-diaminopimelate desuccinylase-like protein
VLTTLTQILTKLCAFPSTSGHHEALHATADYIAVRLRRQGMQVHRHDTPDGPLVIGRLAGSHDRTLLLYHHFDTPPPGPWADWSHDPHQLAERDETFFGRGVAFGKGPLAAHIAAIDAYCAQAATLQCAIVLVADGTYLSGSPHLAAVITDTHELVQADLCLASFGDRDVDGIPICYSGSKGLLQLRLRSSGTPFALGPGFATTVRNPLWRIVAGLNQIKGDDEDIQIEGFYDDIEGPTREENTALREIRLDEAGRRQAWQHHTLFDLSGAALIRAETTLPTCNVSAITTTPATAFPLVPAEATALIDFQLVPHQNPAQITELLRRHLDEKGYADITIERLAGGYAPTHTPPTHILVDRMAAAGMPLYGRPLKIAPAGSFAAPLQIFAEALDLPTLSLGCLRSDSAVYGVDERIRQADLVDHGRFMLEVLQRLCTYDA